MEIYLEKLDILSGSLTISFSIFKDYGVSRGKEHDIIVRRLHDIATNCCLHSTNVPFEKIVYDISITKGYDESEAFVKSLFILDKQLMTEIVEFSYRPPNKFSTLLQNGGYNYKILADRFRSKYL